MLRTAAEEYALDAGRQVRRSRYARMGGEGLGNVIVVACRQRRAGRYPIGCRIMPAEQQEAIGDGLVAARREERRLAVDGHPGALVVNERTVLVEEDASDRHRPAPLQPGQATPTAPASAA